MLERCGQLFGNFTEVSLGLSVTICGGFTGRMRPGLWGPTLITMGLLSLPTMLERGYSKRLACGQFAASGKRLGQIIPPSIVLVILADHIQRLSKGFSWMMW